MPANTSTVRVRTPEDADIRRRRERKRATDRAAQREHRRRQKLYVEDLEAQLALVRGGSLDDQLAQVMRENEKLRTELERYRAFFNTVEDLVMDEWQQDNHAKRKEQTNPTPEQAAAPTPVIPDACPPQTQQSAEQDDAQIYAKRTPDTASSIHIEDDLPDATIDASTSMLATGTSSWNHLSPPGAFDWATSSFAFEDNCHDIGSASSDVQLNAIMWDVPMNPVSDSRPDFANSSTALFSSTTSGREDSQIGVELGTAFPNLFSDDGTGLNSTAMFATQQQVAPLIHQLLPQILEPDTPGDERIQHIIKRAQALGTRLDQPTLSDFLCENPENALSMGIKHYLEPVRKTRRIIEFLATYWVLYLLLRWQINRDEESFYNIPFWLRPTLTQTRVQHPIATDLLAWPLLRDEVIMISLKGSHQAHEILTDVGTHLEIDIPLHNISQTEGGASLHAAVSDLNNWRLSDAFFVKYPVLRPLYDASFHQSG